MALSPLGVWHTPGCRGVVTTGFCILTHKNLNIDSLAFSSSLLTPALASEPHRAAVCCLCADDCVLVPRTVIALPLLT